MDPFQGMTGKKRILVLGLLGALIVLALAVVFLRSHSLKPGKKGGPVVARDTGDFLEKRGEILLKERYAGSLIAVYEKLLSSYPDNPGLKEKLADAYYELGVIASEKGDAEKAERALNRALQLNPNHREAAERLRRTF